MKSRVRPFLQGDENLIHQGGVRPPSQRVLLCFAHLGGSDHLHRFGDLRGVANRFDPAPYVLGVRHLGNFRISIFDFRPASYAIARGLFSDVKTDFSPFWRLRWLEQTFQRCEKIDNCLIV